MTEYPERLGLAPAAREARGAIESYVWLLEAVLEVSNPKAHTCRRREARCASSLRASVLVVAAGRNAVARGIALRV